MNHSNQDRIKGTTDVNDESNNLDKGWICLVGQYSTSGKFIIMPSYTPLRLFIYKFDKHDDEIIRQQCISDC
jgi:hypothetical protein